ncbi:MULTISPECIES: quinone oxidoreductase [Methylocystis]|uniref:Quinone oxidoreductase n=1 Tax=Methylocystis iwaonis TaxID=2885079 RepID=A0ABN6VG28_9HYPH|nr:MULTISPECIES: quinone oxidoreductase [Methylocystis]MDJ0447303.1 quinone oxidoreductase [Methylocystis sp. JR02]BDV33892.1 quinone oxidoreductase [Methylocystis iwaonis]
MVKAIRVHHPGGPEALQLEEVDLPAPGPGEVQIRHRAIGVNFIDIYRRTGAYPAQYPFIPGHEGAGQIVAVGEGVTDFEEGDRVAYVGALGGYSEARNIAADSVIHLPKSVSYEQGAVVMLKGLTAQYLLRRTFRVKKGHRVLVHAGAGGVGQLLCQWADALGAKVIATVGSPDKAEIALKAGARDAILYRTEKFEERVKEITKGKLCDVVYDGVGRATFPASLDCLAPFGLFVSFGSASGPIESFDIGLLTQKGSLFATRPSLFDHIAKRRDYEDMAEDMFHAIKRGHLTIEPPQSFPLAEAAQVHAALESRQTAGSMVLIP